MSIPKLTRRTVLLATGTLGFTVFLGGFFAWKQSKEQDIIVAILKNRLGRLKVDDDIFVEYSFDVVEQRKSFKKELKVLGIFSFIFSVMTPYSLLPMGHPLRRLENYTVSNFLLSTDFFQNGADINRPIKYLGFYSPYKRPCANFFNQDIA